ncbi:hypothetical protein [Nostoc sp.]
MPNTVRLQARDAMNRRLYNNQSFVETAIYRVFVLNLDNKVDLQSFQ